MQQLPVKAVRKHASGSFFPFCHSFVEYLPEFLIIYHVVPARAKMIRGRSDASPAFS
jgi:hypothetical protein